MQKLILLALLTTTFALAQEPPEQKVIKVLINTTRTIELNIIEDTFTPNIQGYACPLPAINVPKYALWEVALAHNSTSMGSFGVTGIGLAVKNPNMRFCDWPSPVDVFGEEYDVGKKIEMKIHLIRQIIKVNGKTILTEKIEGNLLGVNLISQVFLRL